jgi:hypothetical protein
MSLALSETPWNSIHISNYTKEIWQVVSEVPENRNFSKSWLNFSCSSIFSTWLNLKGVKFENYQVPLILHSYCSYTGKSKFDTVLWTHRLFSFQAGLHSTFDINLADSCLAYQICVVTYIFGVATLLYWLADNMWTKSKLTPYRIKIWWVWFIDIRVIWRCRLVLRPQLFYLLVYGSADVKFPDFGK